MHDRNHEDAAEPSLADLLEEFQNTVDPHLSKDNSIDRFRNAEEITARAEEFGCDVVWGDSRTLLIDIDTDHGMAWFERNITIIQERFPGFVARVEMWTSKSGNTHIKVATGEDLDLLERIFLQAVLGSDPTRELLTWVQMGEAPSLDDVDVVLFRPRLINK